MINHFRLARHTDNLSGLKHFYIDILGLELIGEFDHDGYQGLFVGRKELGWHLEFTQSHESPHHQPDADDLLVFYLGQGKAYEDCINRLEQNNYKPVEAKNPYWDKWGSTYLDPDGYGIVISFKTWSNT